MAEANILEIGFLNIVATPHPEGVYLASLKKVANHPINLRGRDYAIISSPVKLADQDELYWGNISVWTDIDSTEPSIDKSTFQQKNVEASLKKIFAERGFNFRSFYYVLDNKKHQVGVELRNELEKTLSISQASRLFDKLLSTQNRQGQTFEITVIPDEDALEKVLELDRLDRVLIVLKRPNPGDHTEKDAEDILRELHEQNVREEQHKFIRQPGTEGIQLNDENMTRAEVASVNGYVNSTGIDDEAHVKRSTREYPEIIVKTLAAGTSFLRTIRDEMNRRRG